jgi:cell division protease FtsH
MNSSVHWISNYGWLLLPLLMFGAYFLMRPRPDAGSSSTPARAPKGGSPADAGRGSPQPRQAAFWWVLLMLLLLWDVSSFFYKGHTPPVAKIPYSSFVEQVEAGNVSQVAIQGSQITGKLVKARDWSPHTGLLSTAPVTEPAPGAKHPKTAQEASKAPEAKTTSSDTSSKGQPTPEKTKAPSKPATKPVSVTLFETVFPSSVGDPDLLPLLEDHKVEIVAAPKAPRWMSSFLSGLLPTLLLVGFFWWMGRRAMNQQQSIFGAGKSQARRFVKEDNPSVTFADVAGADAAKAQLQEIVSILKAPDRYHSLGARTPRGVLLAGPPGTGKTLLARAVAGEAGVPYFTISGSEFVEMFVGVGASRVRNLFKEVKAAAPAILFVDELDAVGRRRGAGLGMVNDEREQTLNQLLVEMDGFDERTSVIVLAATNRPDVLDPALRRPGRFDREVSVGLPDLQGRRGILGIHTSALVLDQDVDLDRVAGITMGMSGAQLANLCNEAALVAAGEDHQRVCRADFEAALDRIVLGDVRPLALDDSTRRVIAYHEGGHALVAWLTPEADPVHKVTIVPHGMALGLTAQRPDEDRYNLSRPYLMARLAVMLGGRSGEEIAIGEITTGAENDLLQATHLARRMVTSWGMSELGLAAYDSSGEDRFLGYELGQGRTYSEDTARRIDQAVSLLLEERHGTVRRMLAEAHERLDRLAEALLERETVEFDELEQLLGPRPA